MARGRHQPIWRRRQGGRGPPLHRADDPGSFPEAESVNHCTDPAEVPTATFELCSSIAREIILCKVDDPSCDVNVMAGDVAATETSASTASPFTSSAATPSRVTPS
ncbi:hypothetical protein ON010_g5775 [Phytophthora cinnamomi]|nr:hypothetical protein ON010_g5775 [Phytophthora cinnamomi]